jgi:hypothetical protein
MSDDISIFVEPKCTLNELVTAIHDITGLQFDRLDIHGSQLYRGMIFGCLIDIYDDHDLVDDQGIEFSLYAFEIDFSKASHQLFGARADGIVDLMPFATAEALSKRFSSRCPVVRNLQCVLEVFEPPPGLI